MYYYLVSDFKYTLYRNHPNDTIDKAKARLFVLATWLGYADFKPDTSLVGGYYARHSDGACLVTSPVPLNSDGEVA